jgi:hypothetical protein
MVGYYFTFSVVGIGGLERYSNMVRFGRFGGDLSDNKASYPHDRKLQKDKHQYWNKSAVSVGKPK